MVNRAKKNDIIDKIDALVESLGLHCREVIWLKDQKTLQIYLDGKDLISLEDCTTATSIILDHTDALDPLMPTLDYQLEVSSPGIEKPLRTSKHFQEVIGENVFVKMGQPLHGKSVFRGKLVSSEAENIAVDVRGENIILPLSYIDSAHLVKGLRENKRKA